MSSVDIRLNEDFMRNYKTRTLRKRLGAEAILSLQSLWLWAAVNRSEGILYKMNPTKIEGVAEWDGKEGDFFTALVDLEWLDVLEDGTYALHQWVEHQSWAADAANRSDKARLLNMAKNYPELYEELTTQGYTGIDRAAYAELTAEYNSRGILRHSSKLLRTASVPLTPTPMPLSAPIPEPVPVPSTTPIPNPSRTPEPESVSEKTQRKPHKVGAKAPTSSSSSFREKESPEILSQNQQAEYKTQAVLATPTESKASIKPEKILVQGVSTEHTETTPTEDSQISETTRAESTTSAEPELSAGQYFSENAVEATVVDILTQWNIQLARLGFPQVLRSTARREAAFKARVHASQERIYLTWWVALFDKIAASDFMCESARQKANWLTLDWVLKEQNMMKILEGKYDSERPVTAEIHGYARTTIRAKTQPTTIRRLTHEEMSGPELYKWEVEHGYDAAGRKKSVVIEANVEDTVSDMTPPALDIGESKDNRETEEASDDFMDFDDFSYEEDADDEASYDYGTDDSNEDEDLTLYGDSGLPTIRRVKGVFQI